jgi:uncharacterized protein YeaO (DUF488 family)
MIKIKRIYEPAEKDDGCRILVDRIWPRGLTKAKAKVDLWLKDIAPSNELRKWFGHDFAKCEGFKDRYYRELKSKGEFLDVIMEKAKKETVTLLYAAKDERCNNAVALRQFLKMTEII